MIMCMGTGIELIRIKLCGQTSNTLHVAVIRSKKGEKERRKEKRRKVQEEKAMKKRR